MKIKSNDLEKKNSENILEEIEVEFDNDKLNEENNFHFNLGFNRSIKNFNDLEVKNKIGQQGDSNPSNNIHVSNFNSKDFKNFEFDINRINTQSNQAPSFFDNHNNINNNNFNSNNFDFDSNTNRDILLSKAEKPKLEIKVNNNIVQNKNVENSDKKQEQIINDSAGFDMFKDFDKNKIPKKNFDFDLSTTQPEKKQYQNPTNLQSNKQPNNQLFNFEIKNNPNNPNGNFHASLPVNPSRVIANGDYYDEVNPPKIIANGDYYDGHPQQKLLLGKDSLLSQTHKLPHQQLSDLERDKNAEELMLKNQNINFDKIILDVFDKKSDKKNQKEKNNKKQKVNFDEEEEFQDRNIQNAINIPPNYINLDDFQSGKMNEYNNQAVNRNARIDDYSSYNKVNNLPGAAEEERANNANFPSISADNDDLYVESSNREDYNMLNNGIFNGYSEKHEKPFTKFYSGSSANTKIIQYLKRKTNIMQDSVFSEAKEAFAKLNKINNNNNSINNKESLSEFKFKKHFAYDAEVLVSQIEAIFLDLFQNYDFDVLKKKLKTPSKEARQRIQSRISYLQTFASFKTNVNLLNFNPGKLKTLESNAKYIREIKSDGNGFYRCFMFALVESYILNENIVGIRNLINDVNELIHLPLSNNLEVNKHEIFGIFNCILENLELNEVANAYAVFVNAYGFSSNFDNVINI